MQEPRNRASPIRIVRLYPHLTPDQRKMIEDAGFGGLLKIGCPTFPLGFCGWLLRRFDTDYCELVIKGRGRIPVTSDSVHRVLGIPNGGGDVKYGLDEDAMAFMSDKLDASGKYWPTVSSIENSLKQMKSADEHFLRTFMVLVISSFLCPTTSLRISPRCFPPLVDIKSIRELNWCKFVVEQLRKSVRAFARKGKNSVPGCLFYLVDTEDTSADEYEDQSSVDGSSRDDDSEDDPDWEQDELNSSKQKRVRTEPGDGAAKSEKGTGEGSGRDSDTPKGNQETGNGRTDDHANLKKRTLACVDGGTSEARSARQKTGEKSGVAVEKMAVQTPSSPLHGGGRPCNSGPRLCDDGRTFKVKEEMEKTPVIDLCTPTSSESDCAVLKTADPSSPVDGPKRAS
uniref:Aminotransferase-like plant mobile domain-containing protein n=1 Tax=Setaria italica TaxID=4555 RepID=K4AAV6_SETIT